MESIGDRLKRLREAKSWSQWKLAKESGLKSQGTIGNIEAGTRGYGDSVIRVARSLGTSPEYLLCQTDDPTPPTYDSGGALDQAPAGSTSEQSHPDNGNVVITHFDVGGGMDSIGRLVLEAEPPGIIKSWRVEREWLRLNVPVYTSINNLCIVTGFGPSMKPLYNPGDPLLMDRGVRTVNHEGVYFFRVGDEGYIKIIQRIPDFDGPGFKLRIISKNPDYPPYEISPNNPHLSVIGKILTVWKSEQF